MKLPLIRHISNFIEKNDEDFVEEAIEVLEHLTEFDGLREEEIDSLQDGVPRKEALNAFMNRVQNSIDK